MYPEVLPSTSAWKPGRQGDRALISSHVGICIEPRQRKPSKTIRGPLGAIGCILGVKLRITMLIIITRIATNIMIVIGPTGAPRLSLNRLRARLTVFAESQKIP